MSPESQKMGADAGLNQTPIQQNQLANNNMGCGLVRSGADGMSQEPNSFPWCFYVMWGQGPWSGSMAGAWTNKLGRN